MARISIYKDAQSWLSLTTVSSASKEDVWTLYMKSFIAKRLNSVLVNLRYLRFKLLKYKENNKKICNTFDHNFKNIPLYIMRKVSLERYYFVLYDYALTSKISKMALKSFCDKTLHMYIKTITGKFLYWMCYNADGWWNLVTQFLVKNYFFIYM